KYEEHDKDEVEHFIDKYLEETEMLNEDRLVMSKEEALKLRELKPTDITKLVFHIDDNSITVEDYFTNFRDEPNSIIELELFKKYLIGYQCVKRKEEFIPSEIEADIYKYRMKNSDECLIFIIIDIISDTHNVEQVFIS